LVLTGLLSEGAHDSSVVSVVYPNFTSDSAETVLCSAGSDGMLYFWDLSSTGIGSGWKDEWDDKDDTQLLAENDDLANLFSNTLSMQRTEDTNASGKPQKLFQICHGQKLNWVTRGTTFSGNNNNTLFVADTSTDITCYTIPMR
jgi:hypothetical protein